METAFGRALIDSLLDEPTFITVSVGDEGTYITTWLNHPTGENCTAWVVKPRARQLVAGQELPMTGRYLPAFEMVDSASMPLCGVRPCWS
jgi:hypothetical protein